MFQNIIETKNVGDLIIHALVNGALIAGFEIDLFDEELYGPEKTEAMLQSILRDLPEGRSLRIYLKSEYSTVQESDHSRSDSIKSIGYVKNRAFVFLEKPAEIDFAQFMNRKKKNTDGVLTDFGLLKDHGIKIRPLQKVDIENLLPTIGSEIHHSFQTIDLGHQVASLLRLTKQSEFGMDLTTLSHIKDNLSLPYLICCSIQAVPQSTAETMLRRRSKQNATGDDIKEARKYAEAQCDLENISLDGTRLFRFEWQCLVTRTSESWLRLDREELRRKLAPLGEIYIESVGALESLKGFYPGEHPHFTLFEKDSALITYMPLMTRGDSKSLSSLTKKSLALHRKDESLTYLNIFDPSYESFSWCIFGRPGSGKSVLTNALTRALIYDPEVKIIKIDVGGSHSKETELLGGVEKTLNLNEPTGINPFDVLRELGPTKEAIQILASFLEVLILEEGESKLSKTMKSDIERAIQKYAESNPIEHTLHDFCMTIQDLPRQELFQRWIGKGVYGNAFAPQAKSPGAEGHELYSAASLSDRRSSRLLYYNFSKISQALDPDYAQGGLAAVMAQFNLEMLKKSHDKKRIVFIADETPFFIKKCFSFFNLSIANVRKEGHGFITVAQKSAHVVVDNDTGILDNSPNKIFFSLDGDEESFMSRSHLNPDSIEKIKSLKRKQGEFSEALFKDIHGERVIRIKLNPLEYWSYTSKDEDRRKYQELKTACPSLTTEEVVRCLSL
ncbi:MAG: hypothetical protein BroJett040_08020 [Oligoflexia bacterium]|nr:MAG: hypothetical protein BroJett040_08020 [Oligoflexia bacterium]